MEFEIYERAYRKERVRGENVVVWEWQIGRERWRVRPLSSNQTRTTSVLKDTKLFSSSWLLISDLLLLLQFNSISCIWIGIYIWYNFRPYVVDTFTVSRGESEVDYWRKTLKLLCRKAGWGRWRRRRRRRVIDDVAFFFFFFFLMPSRVV